MSPKSMSRLLLIGALGFVFLSCQKKTPELLFQNSDFEMGTLEHWEKTGDAFNSQPILGDNIKIRNRGESKHAGRFWIGTYERSQNRQSPDGGIQGDGPMGSLESDDFVIKAKRISFLIGGGQGSELTGVGLKVNNQLVLFEPGRGRYVDKEELHSVTWDVSQWLGKKARIVIRDEAADAWGHINADDFRYR